MLQQSFTSFQPGEVVIKVTGLPSDVQVAIAKLRHAGFEVVAETGDFTPMSGRHRWRLLRLNLFRKVSRL